MICRTGLLALAVGAGLQVMTAMKNADVAAVPGRRASTTATGSSAARTTIGRWLQYPPCYSGHLTEGGDGRPRGVRMPAPRPEEFRRRAVELARLQDKSIAQIAKDLGIAEYRLRR